MLNYKGIYLPDGEVHLVEWMEIMKQFRDGLPCYQYHKYEAALGFCLERRVAIDVGAHVGLWSRVMALDFEHLVAFEPVPAHAECWRANMAQASNALLKQVALGEKTGEVSMRCRTQGSSGDTTVAKDGEEPNAAVGVQMRKLDEYDFRRVDLMKLDNEGYEFFALRGAEQTLRRCRPVVVVEQKPGMPEQFGLGDRPAVTFLESLGAKVLRGIQGDYIMGWV